MTSSYLVEKKLISVLKGNPQNPPPIWLMRQAGRHLQEYKLLRSKAKSFLDFCYSPDLCIEATLQPLKRYQLDAAILFSDILVIPDALGQQVKFIPEKGPALEALESVAQFKSLSCDNIFNHLSPIYEAIKEIKLNLKKNTNNPALIGFAGSPWTVATYMIEGGGSKDFYKVKKWAYQDPKSFQKLIDILIYASTEHLHHQIESGVEIIQLFDSWAGVLPPVQFDKWVVEPTKKIVNDINLNYPHVPVIGFPRGSGLLYKRFINQTGVDAISIDASIPLTWAVENLQKECTIQGNLDNLSLLIGGTMMEAEIANILAAFSSGPFVFNLGHGILPETPIQNVERLVELVRGFLNG